MFVEMFGGMISQTKEILLRDDPHLLDKYAGKFIHSNGSEELCWKVNGVVVMNERTARYTVCTHVRCQDCDNIAEKTWTKCPTCIEKSDKERLEKRKQDAKTVLTSIPEPGVYCEELYMFFFTDSVGEIQDEIEVRLEKDIDLSTLSFFGLKKDVRGIDLSYVIGEDMEDGFELDDEGEELEKKVSEYCERHAHYLPDYSIWVQLTNEEI